MNGEGSGQGLLIIAAVIIAFVNWLSNTLKTRAEQKEAAKRRERRLADGDQGQSAPEEAWPQQETRPATTEPRQADPSQQLRDFFESLTGNSPPPPPEPVVVPPPVQRPSRRAEEPQRWKAPKVKRADLSAEERQALVRIAAVRPKSRGRAGQHPVIDRLRTPAAAQEAVILAEILGKPKALAD